MKKTVIGTLGFAAFQSTQLFADGMDGTPLPPDQGLWQTLTMVAIALLFFYFILMRPEQKRRKAMDDLRSKIKKGDRVVAMGIIGTVVKVQDNTVVLKMYDGAKIEVLKGAIGEVTPGSDDDIKKLDKDDT